MAWAELSRAVGAGANCLQSTADGPPPYVLRPPSVQSPIFNQQSSISKPAHFPTHTPPHIMHAVDPLQTHHRNQRHFIIALTFFASLLPSPALAADTKPNILFVLADQWRA